MNISNKRYVDLVEKRQHKPKVFSDCLKAFFVGGLICTLGEVIRCAGLRWGLEDKDARTLVCICLIASAEILTATGLFYKIAKFAGAGTLVPITGFANAVASPAVDFKSEGYIMGVGAKIFIIAGPVILYGISASIVYGFIYYLAGVIR